MADHLGSVRATVNEDGEVVHYDDYYPFGAPMPLRSSVSDGPAERFTGYEVEDDIDANEKAVYYAGARYYDALIARWNATDPLDQYHSPYVYVGNSPLVLVDPNGMYSEGPSHLATRYFDENGKLIYDDGIDNGLDVHTTREIIDRHTLDEGVDWDAVRRDNGSRIDVTDPEKLRRWMNGVAQLLMDQGYRVELNYRIGDLRISRPMGPFEMSAMVLGPFAITKMFSGLNALVGTSTRSIVQFGRVSNQVHHAFRHIDSAGLDRSAVRAAITRFLSRHGSRIAVGETQYHTVVVGGQTIKFSAHKLPNGIINVGRIHPVP